MTDETEGAKYILIERIEKILGITYNGDSNKEADKFIDKNYMEYKLREEIDGEHTSNQDDW